MARIKPPLETLVIGEARRGNLDDKTGFAGVEPGEPLRRFLEQLLGKNGDIRLEHDPIGKPQCCFDPDRQMVRQGADDRDHQSRFDPLMRDPLGRHHHHDFPLDQLELLVLADDAGLDHATDVLDGEYPARETFGSCGGDNVHATMRS
jgi:hypothetical protein